MNRSLTPATKTSFRELRLATSTAGSTYAQELKDARRTGAMAVNIFDRDLFSPLPETDSQSEIDPYLPDEREQILNGLLQHKRHYHTFVFHQFWTGCRPSEACALRRRDCDLNYGWERIDKSRVSGRQDGPRPGPATARSSCTTICCRF
jgi:integrase